MYIRLSLDCALRDYCLGHIRYRPVALRCLNFVRHDWNIGQTGHVSRMAIGELIPIGGRQHQCSRSGLSGSGLLAVHWGRRTKGKIGIACWLLQCCGTAN
jgi:hypothetical protein